MVKYTSQIIMIFKIEKHIHRGSIPFCACVLNLIKMQIPSTGVHIVLRIDIVWRLSEFAFFVLLLR